MLPPHVYQIGSWVLSPSRQRKLRMQKLEIHFDLYVQLYNIHTCTQRAKIFICKSYAPVQRKLDRLKFTWNFLCSPQYNPLLMSCFLHRNEDFYAKQDLWKSLVPCHSERKKYGAFQINFLKICLIILVHVQCKLIFPWSTTTLNSCLSKRTIASPWFRGQSYSRGYSWVRCLN